MSWTDERINLLKRMWKEGKSAADIAKTLAKGVTRNAVIGKAHRMGLSGRPSPIKKPVAVKKEATPKKEAPRAGAFAAKKPLAVVAPAAGGKAKSNPALDREAEELKKIEKAGVQIGGGVALIDLTERMCKWPIGDPREAEFSFCGLGIRPGTPYCPGHAALAYQTSSRGRTAAAAAQARAAVPAISEVKDDDVDVDVDTDADADDDDAEEIEADTED